LVIDPYSKLDLQLGKYGKETDFVKEMLAKLTALSRSLDILTIVVAHPAKQFESNKPPGLNEISGSQHWWNAADYGIIVHRNRDEITRELENKSDIIVAKVKNKHIGNPTGGKIELYADHAEWRLKEYQSFLGNYKTTGG